MVPDAYGYLMLPLGYLVRPDIFPAWLWALATLAQVVVIAVVATGVVDLMRTSGRRSARGGVPEAQSTPAAATVTSRPATAHPTGVREPAAGQV